MAQDRVHALLFGLLLFGGWRWYKTLKKGTKQTVTVWALTFLSLYFVVTLIAGITTPPQSPQPGIKAYAGPLGKGLSGEGYSIITCELDIFNAGSPTTLRAWRLEVTIPGDTPIQALLISPIPEKLEVPYPSGRTQTLARSDWLPLKAAAQPIPQGGSVSGFVMFQMPNKMDIKYLDTPGTLFRLSFLDITDRNYDCDYRISSAMKPYLP